MLTSILIDMLLDTELIERSSVIILGIAESTHTISTKGAVIGSVLFEKTSARFGFYLIKRALAGDGCLGLLLFGHSTGASRKVEKRCSVV